MLTGIFAVNFAGGQIGGGELRRIRFLIKNQVNRPGFKVCLAILFLLGTGGVVMCCAQNFGSDRIFLRSAADNFFLVSTDARVMGMLFAVMFPLLAASLCSGGGGKKGNELFVRLKMSRRQYIYGNAFVAVGMTAVWIMISLGINQLLCLAAFPLTASDNKWGMYPYALPCSADYSLLLDFWSVQNSYVYNILYIVLIGVLGGGIALLTYGLSYLQILRKLKPVQLSVVVFAAFFALSAAGTFLDMPMIDYLNYVQTACRVSLREYGIFTGAVYAAGIALTIWGEKMDECL